MEYVILAAGQGSRFTKEGETTPKPMVDILGRPMIGRLIDILMECGAEKILIATNSSMRTLNDYLSGIKTRLGLTLEIRPIVSDNSFFSLTQACMGAKGRFIAMTVDAIFPTEEFRQYVRQVEASSPDEILMGLTEYIDDESPLYAKLTPDATEIVDYRYGGEPFAGTPVVSAGLYGLTPAAIEAAQADGYPSSLSDFQRILATGSRFTVKPFLFSKAFDVDCGHDRTEAEKFVAEVNGERRR